MPSSRAVDTLEIARKKFPGAQIVEVRMAEDNAAAPSVPEAIAADVEQDEVAFEDQFSIGEDGDDYLFD